MRTTALALVCKRVRDRQLEVESSHSTNLPPLSYPMPYFQQRPGGPEGYINQDTVGIEIQVFDPQTLIPYKLDPYFQPSMMLNHMKIPPVPDYIRWTHRQTWKVGFRELPDPITDPKVQKAEQLAKYISFKMYGKVIEKKSAD